MAGDWIKLCCDTPDKPEVHSIAETLKMDPDAVLGKLTRIWIWFQNHTENGNAPSATLALLDRIASATGFGAAMQNVDWLSTNEHGLCMPHFDYHNGKPAKTRSLAAIRASRSRNARSVTKAHQRREEKRVEDTGVPVSSAAPRKPPPPNPIWDAVAELWYPSGVPPGERTRLGKVCRDLKAVGATAETIRAAHAAVPRLMPDVKVFGPETLVKNWAQLQAPVRKKTIWDEEDK